MLKKCIILFLFCGLPFVSLSQKIEIFKIADFDLKGSVKSSTVITDYGKEEYFFDPTGRLTKSITSFNNQDYQTTYYKHDNSELLEKRVENYRDNIFDKATSIANFYTVDTLENRKITEKIVSYTKELLEQNIYQYNENGELVSFERTDTNGTDESIFIYTKTEAGHMVMQELNGIPVESVETKMDTLENKKVQKTVLTVHYFDGELNTKKTEVYNANNKLLSRSDTFYDSSTGSWIPEKEIAYTYDENGNKASLKTRHGISTYTTTSTYIYQFDGTEANNWVREIISPANTYRTRKIKYYSAPSPALEEKKN